MTSKEIAKNMKEWISLLFPDTICIDEDYSYFPHISYPEFEIMIFDDSFTILAMSWHYDFYNIEHVLEFIESWGLA